MRRRKFLSLALAICLVFQTAAMVACQKVETEPEDKEHNQADVGNAGDVKEDVKVPTKQAEGLWAKDFAAYDVNVPYEVPEYTPTAEGYSVSPDLSDLFNAGQYEGFTEKQLKALYEDGFVVLKGQGNAKLHQVYERAMYKESPFFITADAAMHLYHIFYDDSLKYVEVSSLYDKLGSMSQALLTKSLSAYGDSANEAVKDRLSTVAAYFLTACNLLGCDLPEGIPEEIANLSAEEMKLIDKAEDFTKSPLLGRDSDYSQFKVRGHYAGNDALEKYFRAMMWYGLCGFPARDEKGELCLDQLTEAMIMTCMVLDDEAVFESYESIYTITAMYAGASDDLGVMEFRDLVMKVYGPDPEYSVFADSSYNAALEKAVDELRSPEIRAKYTESDAPADKQFRFMGQRYTFDGEIMQRLMEPILRPVPSGLDVVAALGSDRAEELLDTYYKPKEAWPDYADELESLKAEDGLREDGDWMKDLYSGWLWSIKSSAKSFEGVEGMPAFMRGSKWTDKSIHTALGSYAELKHDSILYSKQPVAEMGGGGDYVTPYNYVEPNVELFAKLKWLTAYTQASLSARGLMDDVLKDILDRMYEAMDVFVNVSVKELTNQAVTEEENEVLFYFGGRIDYISSSLKYNLEQYNIKNTDDETSALIADVATIAPNSMYPHGTYLEIGNALPLDIYVICRTNGKTYLAKGALFNYYEFLSDDRLTDAQWRELVGARRMVVVSGDTYETTYRYDDDGNDLFENGGYDFDMIQIEEPSTRLPDKPEWTESFISDEPNNTVLNYDMGLDWSR